MRLNFKRLGLLGGRYARAVAKYIGLTPAGLDFVALLMNGALCQRDIAAKLCVTEAVISKMVRGLMRDGLVQREIPATDRRFRVVSLTDHGRAQYRSLTHCEWFMDPDARHDAQSLGEEIWSECWEKPLREMKLGLLREMFCFDFEGPQPPDPPYAAIRRHRLRELPYRDPLCGLGDWFFEPTWPATIRELAPPLRAGTLADPVSVAYANAWQARCAARAATAHRPRHLR